ncbi:DNA-binding protein [Pseudomonas putida]|uniref:DNA-binding protein n=1 Tax=Pseudomonas putida TaxID=303 RepID=UPI0022B3B90B|nr:DNA-binding protein [Pseudomonas putida]
MRSVERVRLELGRGSPARVGSLLNIWRGLLAKRVQGETRMPGMPREVTEAVLMITDGADDEPHH